jgi:hypothetical protein
VPKLNDSAEPAELNFSSVSRRAVASVAVDLPCVSGGLWRPRLAAYSPPMPKVTARQRKK